MISNTELGDHKARLTLSALDSEASLNMIMSTTSKIKVSAYPNIIVKEKPLFETRSVSLLHLYRASAYAVPEGGCLDSLGLTPTMEAGKALEKL